MPKPEPPRPPVSQVMALGKHWVAIILADGSVLLQHHSQVPVCGTDKIYNLMEVTQEEAEHLAELKEKDPERIAVRTVLMSYDGSVLCDPDGISPNGNLTPSAFTLIPPTIYSCSKYFSRNTGRDDW